MDFLEFLKIIILGIVEGITEWLPISSTGHMLLVDEFLPVDAFAHEEFKSLFMVVVQLGAIFAVILLFWQKIFPFGKTKSGKVGVQTDKIILWTKIIVACVPTAIFGLLFEDMIDRVIGDGKIGVITIAITLTLYGILFIVIERRNKGRKARFDQLATLPYSMAFMIGLFQCLALIPGTSRSGATIIGAMLLGTSRVVAAEFTFFLAIPTMAGASLLKILKAGFAFSGYEYTLLLVGMIVAFIVSFFCIKLLMRYISKHDFAVFGWYRIGLGIVVAIYYVAKYL